MQANNIQAVKERVLNRTTNAALSFPINTETKINGLGQTLESYSPETQVRQTFLYNNEGRLERAQKSYEGGTTPSSETFETFYDSLGRAIEAKHDGATLWQKQFSGLGNLTTVKDPKLNATTFDYDLLGRIRKTTYPDLTRDEITAINYYPEGSSGPLYTVNVSKRNGRSETLKYNKQGQISVKEASHYPSMNENFYYSNMRLTEKKSWNSEGIKSRVWFENFDQFGRPTLESTSLYYGPLFSVGREYDEQGALIRHTYPDVLYLSGEQRAGPIINYERDRYGRIRFITSPNFGAVPRVFAEYNYDGPILTSQILDGVFRQFNYQGAKPLSLLYGFSDVEPYGETLLNVSYDYDERLRPKTRIGLLGAGIVESFTYDNHNMLHSYASTNGIAETYDPNLDGTLAGIQNNFVDSMYKLTSAFIQYDGDGNPGQTASRDRLFNWGYYGLNYFTNGPSYTVYFNQDSFGRYIRVDRRGHWPYDKRQSIMVRDSGMILVRGDDYR